MLRRRWLLWLDEVLVADLVIALVLWGWRSRRLDLRCGLGDDVNVSRGLGFGLLEHIYAETFVEGEPSRFEMGHLLLGP